MGKKRELAGVRWVGLIVSRCDGGRDVGHESGPARTEGIFSVAVAVTGGTGEARE
jgi:hypothetical protein